MLVLSATAVAVLAESGMPSVGGTPTEWAAALWERGLRVVYQPEAIAVRACPVRADVGLNLRISQAWASRLEERPDRPSGWTSRPGARSSLARKSASPVSGQADERSEPAPGSGHRTE